jgi:hypothetical protein
MMTPALLEIDGPDVHPDTVDPRVAAQLIATFFDVLGRAARVRGVALDLHGIFIKDKCLQVISHAAAPELAVKAMEVMAGWVNGSEQADSQLDQQEVRHFNSLVRKISKGGSAKLAVGTTWERQLTPTDELPGLPPQATTTLRVKLLDIGVGSGRARFSSGSEDGEISLPVTVEQVEKLRHYVNEDLDLFFAYRRNRFGRIDDGEILDFHPMEVDDQGEEWLRWLTENGRHWDNVADPLEELGRRED